MKPIIKKDLKLLFVGINPHPANKGHYFNSNKTFWKLLFKAGLTDKIIDDTEILSYNYGIVNLTDRPTVSAKELRQDELSMGAYSIKLLADDYEPRFVVALGNMVYMLLKKVGIKNLKVIYFPTSRTPTCKKMEALEKLKMDLRLMG